MGLRSSKLGDYNSQKKEEKDERSQKKKTGRNKRKSSSIFDRRRKKMIKNEKNSLQDDFDKVNVVKYDPVSNKPQNAEELHHIDDVLACLPINIISRKYPEYLQRNSVANVSVECTDQLSEKDNVAHNLEREIIKCMQDGSEKQNGNDSKTSCDKQVNAENNEISSKLIETYKLLSDIKKFLKNYTVEQENLDNFELTAKYCSIDADLDKISVSLEKTETSNEKYNEEKSKLTECVELFQRIVAKRLEFFNENEENTTETAANSSVKSCSTDEDAKLEITSSLDDTEGDNEEVANIFRASFGGNSSAPCNSPIERNSDEDGIDSDDSWSEQTTVSPCGSPSKEDIVYVDYNGLYTINEEDEEES